MLNLKPYLYGGLALALLYGAYQLFQYHKDAIDTAVVAAENTMILKQEQAINIREEELLTVAKADLQEVGVRLEVSRKKVNDLERQLLIEHDLDRLLQRKPGLVLKIVNKGTREYLKELEEITK